MNDRRPLVDGLKPQTEPDRAKEKEFVYGPNTNTVPATNPDAGQPASSTPSSHRGHGRSPVSTRIRSDYAEALKKASLERQLNAEVPNTVQDILEEALGPWLKVHGYLK